MLWCLDVYVDVGGTCGGVMVFFFQAEDGIRYLVRSRGLGDVYKRQRQVDDPDKQRPDRQQDKRRDQDERLMRVMFFRTGMRIVFRLSLIHI